MAAVAGPKLAAITTVPVERRKQRRHAAPAEPRQAERQRRKIEQHAGQSGGGGRRGEQGRGNEARACADEERYQHLSLSRLLKERLGVGHVPPQLC